MVQICFVIHCSYVKRVEHFFSVAEKAKKCCRVVCTWTLLMAPLVAFCAFDPLFARLSVEYSPQQYKHSVSLFKFSSSDSTRLGSSQFSESKNDHSLHLVFTMNNWNICVTRTGLSLLLQPYFGGRLPLISSFFSVSVILKFIFLRRAHPDCSGSFPVMLVFSWLFLFPAKGIWNRANVREVNNNNGVFWGEEDGVTVA